MHLLVGRRPLFLSGQCANADPVGDFSKKLASRFRRLSNLSRRSSKPERRGAPGGPLPENQMPPRRVRVHPKSHRNLLKKRSLLPLCSGLQPRLTKKRKRRYALWNSGPRPEKGMVTSPYLPEGNYIDVSAFAPGSAVKDPYTGKIFRVP
jgi:hypothetical protein